MRATLTVLVLICHCGLAHGKVEFDWATVGDAGNAPTVMGPGGEGAVGYEFRISKHEVTNEQYAEFLNKVALADPLELFHPEMKITRTGESGSYSYEAQSRFERHPVTYVRYFDAMRFVNWLENGQGAGGTEDGVYTIGTGASETRASSATYFIPNNDEWYKAAYYDPTLANGAGGYWAYATQSNDFPAFEAPPGGANSVNTAESDLGGPTAVGAYADSTSFYGSFDQTGNLWEWTETLHHRFPARCMRGGAWGSSLFFLTSCHFPGDRVEGNLGPFAGLRVARSVPEPSSLVSAAVAFSVLVMSSWRRPKLRTLSRASI